LATRVNVQVNTSRLGSLSPAMRASTHYTGSILVVPDDDDEEQDIEVRVEVDVLSVVENGRSSSSTMNGQSRPGPFPGVVSLDEEETVIASASGTVMVPRTPIAAGPRINKAKR